MDLSKQDLEIAGSLRRLLKSRFVLRSRNERWFQIVIDRRAEIERLARSLALTLDINESLGLAFLKPIDDETEEALAYQAGRKRTLGHLSSALVYKLRHQRLQFFMNPANDSVPLTTLEEMREFLQNFNSAKIDSQFERAFRKALDELAELQIIQETKPDSGLFEISPLCEILLPLDEITSIKARMENFFASSADPMAVQTSPSSSDQSFDSGASDVG